MAKKYTEEQVIAKTGGRFKLATILEKRYKELLFGGRALVETQSTDPLEILTMEIMDGKTELIPESEAIAAARLELIADKSNEAREEVAAREKLESHPKRELTKGDDEEDEDK